jgi:hypothetical protein
MVSRRAQRPFREYGPALRRLAAATILGASLAAQGAAPPEGEAARWRDRTREAIEELAGVGVDASRYRAHWTRADSLDKKGMREEAIIAFRRLASALEGWEMAALTDSRIGPSTRDPRAEDTPVLAGPAGYGRWRPPTLREKLDGSRSGAYRRPLSGDSRMTLAHKIDHERLKERARAADSAAAERWREWIDESDRPRGAATGAVRPRLAGGKTLEHERPAPPDSDDGHAGPGALDGAAGVGSYRGRPTKAAVVDVGGKAAPLVGSQGVGGYGHPIRMARDEITPRHLPDYERPPPGWPGERRGPNPDPKSVGEPIRRPDPEPVTRVVADAGGTGDDPDLGDGLGDLGDLDDLGDPTDEPLVDPPKRPDGPSKEASIQDLLVRKVDLAGELVRVTGNLGERAPKMPRHVRRLSGGQTDGRVLVSVYAGAVQVDVLAVAGWVEDLRPDTEVVVEGLYVVDPEAESPDEERLLIADSVAPK